MDYILNNEVIYNSFDGSIRQLRGRPENSVVFTEIANKILLLLISRQGEVVSRDEFFHEIWDKEGLISSANTLNQYVSKLRKTFSDFFPDQTVISTVPRVGYFFSKDIDIQKYIIKDAEESMVRTHKKKLYLIMGCMLLAILFLVVVFFDEFHPVKTPRSVPRLINHYQSCPIYEVSGVKGLETDKVQRKVAIQAISLSKITCEPNSSFYIFTNKIKYVNKQTSVLISKCSEWKNHRSTCKNVYYTNWK